jgi:hypothetical protein
MKLAEPTKFNRKSGGAKWRDLRFSRPASDANGSAALPFVIPTEPRISYYAAPPMTTYAAFRKESRMKFANATKPRQEIRGKWRDPQFSSLRATAPGSPCHPSSCSLRTD